MRTTILVGLLAFGAIGSHPAPGTTPARPNILLIAADDLNDWVGPLGGHPQVKTPHLDRLARRGTTFVNAHCQAPLCNPSRTSVLTGRRPSTTGVYALDPWFRTARPLRELVTLPQYFMRHGYRVMTTGKTYHDAYPPQAGRAPDTEFNVWGPHGGFQPRPAQKFVNTPDPIPLMDWGPFPARDEDCFDYDVADWAAAQLRAAAGEQPFLLFVGFRHPHVPCYAPAKWFDLYPVDKLKLPPVKPDDRADVPPFAWYLHWKLPEPRLAWLQANDQWRPLVRAYLASVSFLDAMVGRVLAALEASPHATNTVVIFWSDHGWHLGEKDITGKNTLWERSTRVPLIAAGPGVAGGARCRQPVELLDLFPTLVEWCGLPRIPELEGHSLVPQLKRASETRPWPAITTHGPDNHSVRSKRHRYIRYADGAEELYDLKRDPNEWRNLAADPRHARTKRDLARWLPQLNVPPVPGSRTRLLVVTNGVPVWEGTAIRAGEAVP